MGTHKLIKKLEEFFDLSKKKQLKKQEKLQEIIARLEEKQQKIKQEMVTESEANETSERFHELDQKFQTISKLLKKARKNSVIE